jgi:hypothetical protein
MKLSEIIIQDIRDERPEFYAWHFGKPIVYQQKMPFHDHQLTENDRLIFKLVEEQFESHLGIFSGDDIIAYVSMHQFLSGYQVDMTATNPNYRNQGFIRWQIEFATNRYKKIYSDSRHSQDAKGVWSALIKNPNNSAYFYVNVSTEETVPVIYDRNLNQITPDPWNDSEDVLILATPKNLSLIVKQQIQERLERDIRQQRPDRWLGSGFDFPNP